MGHSKLQTRNPSCQHCGPQTSRSAAPIGRSLPLMTRHYAFLLLLPWAGILAALVFAAPSLRAQQPSCAPSFEAKGQQPLPLPVPSVDCLKQESKASATMTHEQQTGTSNERLFWVLPDFLLIEDAKNLPPLSAGAKFRVVARSSFDYIDYPVYGMLAGISQAENSEPGYGRGASGYGKRYGAAFADGTIESFVTGAILPSILRQDPRYYQLGKGGFWRRTGYAIGHIFVTRADSGRIQFNYSEIVGSSLSAGISTYSYHPSNQRTVRNSLSVWGTQVGYDTISTVFNEFWPDIHRHFGRRQRT